MYLVYLDTADKPSSSIRVAIDVRAEVRRIVYDHDSANTTTLPVVGLTGKPLAVTPHEDIWPAAIALAGSRTVVRPMFYHRQLIGFSDQPRKSMKT